MKSSRFRPALYALLCSAGFLHADVVTLKDGKKLEGNIISEGPEGIRMKYHLTPKIWDEKNILHSDIASIVKQTPEEVELIELRKTIPTPDLMSAEKYEQLIQDRLRPFVNRYPGTKEAAEVDKMIAEVQGEKEKVVAGGAKLEGKWLTPDEAKAESYNIKAFGLRAAMNEKAAENNYVGALKEFDKLSNPSGGYVASIYYPKAVEEAIAILTKYEAQLEQMIKDQPTLEKMREESIKKLIEPDLSRLKDAIAREKEQWKTTSDLERKSDSKWYTPYKYDMASLKDLSKNVVTEKTRLKEIDLATVTKVNESLAEIMRADAKASKEEEALKKMGESIIAGETAAAGLDEASKQVYGPVFQAYRARYAYAQQQLAIAAMPKPEPTAAGTPAGSTAISGNANPGEDPRMAAALAAAASGGTAAPATAAPQAVQPGVAPTAGYPTQQPQAGYPTQQPQTGYPAQQPQAGYPTQQPQAGVPPTGYPPQGQQPAYAQPQSPTAMPMPAAPVEDEGMETSTLLMIGMGVVLLVLLVALVGGKKKKK